MAVKTVPPLTLQGKVRYVRRLATFSFHKYALLNHAISVDDKDSQQAFNIDIRYSNISLDFESLLYHIKSGILRKVRI